MQSSIQMHGLTTRQLTTRHWPLNSTSKKFHTAAGNDNTTIYKTWDDGFLIRMMTKHDALLVQEWPLANHVRTRDLEIAIESNIQGSRFYVGELNGEVVVSGITVCVAKGLHYGGYRHVKEECRGLGFGQRIMKLGMAYIEGAIMALDCEKASVGLYYPAGAKKAFSLSRSMGPVPLTWDNNLVVDTVQISLENFSTLIEYDNLCFIRSGSPQRKSILQSILFLPTSFCIAAVDESGNLIGYGCRRPALTGGSHIIGPLYADTYKAAYSIVHGLCAGLHGGHIIIDVCWNHQGALQLTETLQLKPLQELVRMYTHGHPRKLSHRIYGLTSLDFCGF